jgi:hypothetical protein
MLRTAAIGLVSAIALGVSLASPATAMGGHAGGGAAHGAGGAVHGAGAEHGSMMAARSDASPGRLAEHDMGRMGRDYDHDRDHGRDRDHDRNRHDHDRLRLFPSFAFGIDTYADTYAPNYTDCWELHRVFSHGAWRLRRFWACD